MNQTVNIDVRVDSRSINQLEDELSQVQAELKKISTTDPKFQEYAQDAQKLTRELDKANTAAEGFTSEKKFQAADGSIKLMAGTLSGVVGTLGLIGVESEVFGEMEQKAASAIAVAMGIKDVSEGFNQLKTALAGAIPKLAALNATMLLNPAVLIAAGIAAVGVAIYAMTTYTTDAEERMEELNDEIERAKELLDGTVQSYENLTQAELNAFKQEKEDLELLIKSNAEKGIRFNKDKEKLEQLDQEIEKREKIIGIYKEQKIQQDAFNKSIVDETADIKDKIALYGDGKESGLIALKLQLLRVELSRTDDYKTQRDLLREIAILEQRRAEVLGFEDRKPEEKLEVTKEGPSAGLPPEVQLAIAGMVATSDMSDKLTKHLAENAKKQSTAVVMSEEEKMDAQMQTLANMEFVAGQETKVGKALLIARQLMLAKKLIMDVKDYIMEVKINAAKAKSNLIVGQSKAASTLNPLVISMFAVQAISIYRSIRQALAASKQSDDGGGFNRTPMMDTRRGEAININPDQVQQLSASNSQTVRSYVVSGDVRSSQEAEAKIASRRTLD
jgi:hypothetical protein